MIMMLIAVAMSLAPLAMPAGEAAAAPMASHHGEMATAGHCGEAPDTGQADKAVGKSCCVAGCMSFAIDRTTASDLPITGLLERPGADRFRLGYLGEIATPPPRLA